MSKAYTFPLLTLTETDTFTKFCTKYLSDSRLVKELGLQVLLRRNGVGARTRAKFYCTILNMQSASTYSNNIIKEVQLKTEFRRTASVMDHAQYALYTQFTAHSFLPCGKLYYMKKCYAVDAALPVNSVFNWTAWTNCQPLQETLGYYSRSRSFPSLSQFIMRNYSYSHHNLKDSPALINPTKDAHKPPTQPRIHESCTQLYTCASAFHKS
jgi:hypothetical protein